MYYLCGVDISRSGCVVDNQYIIYAKFRGVGGEESCRVKDHC